MESRLFWSHGLRSFSVLPKELPLYDSHTDVSTLHEEAGSCSLRFNVQEAATAEDTSRHRPMAKLWGSGFKHNLMSASPSASARNLQTAQASTLEKSREDSNGSSGPW